MRRIYDQIGTGYSALRKSDPRLYAQIHKELGPAKTVLNVGAGTGSYEPIDKHVVSLEPSGKMIEQRLNSKAKIVQGQAEYLPFRDASFDASMAILTIHHWANKARGLAEIRRVTRGPVVILTFDPDFQAAWLNAYFPELIALDNKIMPKIDEYKQAFECVTVHTVRVPHDCVDGFMHAYWRRPEAYLDPIILAAMSPFQMIAQKEEGLRKLKEDLESGAWHEKYQQVVELDDYDAGYRLIISH